MRRIENIRDMELSSRTKSTRFFLGYRHYPPDWQLDWDFQHHVLCQKDLGQDKEGGLLELASQIRTQHKQFEFINGLYTVTEISSQGQYITYRALTTPSALEVEEWCLDISPKSFTTAHNGFPMVSLYQTVDPTDDMPWSRVM